MENVSKHISHFYPNLKSSIAKTYLENLLANMHKKGLADGKASFTSAMFKSQAKPYFDAHLAGSTPEELKMMRMGKSLDKCRELVDQLIDSIAPIKAQEVDKEMLRKKGLDSESTTTENVANLVYKEAYTEAGREQVRLALMPLADAVIRKQPSPMRRPKTDIPPSHGTEVAASSKRRAQSELRHLTNANDLFDFSEALAAFTRNARKAGIKLGSLEEQLFDSFRTSLKTTLKNHPVKFEKDDEHGPKKS